MRLQCSIQGQWLRLLDSDRIVKSYTISTSAKPPSCIEDSLGTPTGLHEIVEKIGDAEPLGTVFKGRKSIGKTYSELPEEEQRGTNLITTRILRLRGLEPGHNAGNNAKGQCVDSYKRYIYIHGTNHEEKLGQPQSAGCILLSNTDMLELFVAVEVGAQVDIRL